MINETRDFKMLVRVTDFESVNQELFPENSLAGRLFQVVRNTVNELSAYAASEVRSIGADRGGATSINAARERLRRRLRAMQHTARVAEVDTPEFADKFFLPRGRLVDPKLLAAAHAFAKDAGPLAEAFIKHEMPPDFEEKLQLDIRNFEAALNSRASGGELYEINKTHIKASTQQALASVSRLDAIVRNKLQGDSVRLEAWRRAIHRQRVARSKATVVEATPSTDTSTQL